MNQGFSVVKLGNAAVRMENHQASYAESRSEGSFDMGAGGAEEMKSSAERLSNELKSPEHAKTAGRFDWSKDSANAHTQLGMRSSPPTSLRRADGASLNAPHSSITPTRHTTPASKQPKRPAHQTIDATEKVEAVHEKLSHAVVKEQKELAAGGHMRSPPAEQNVSQSPETETIRAPAPSPVDDLKQNVHSADAASEASARLAKAEEEAAVGRAAITGTALPEDVVRRVQPSDKASEADAELDAKLRDVQVSDAASKPPRVDLKPVDFGGWSAPEAILSPSGTVRLKQPGATSTLDTHESRLKEAAEKLAAERAAMKLRRAQVPARRVSVANEGTHAALELRKVVRPGDAAASSPTGSPGASPSRSPIAE